MLLFVARQLGSRSRSLPGSAACHYFKSIHFCLLTPLGRRTTTTTTATASAPGFLRAPAKQKLRRRYAVLSSRGSVARATGTEKAPDSVSLPLRGLLRTTLFCSCCRGTRTESHSGPLMLSPLCDELFESSSVSAQ